MAIGPAVIAAFDAVVMTVMVIVQMMVYVNIRLTLVAVIPMIFIAFGELYFGKIMQKRWSGRRRCQTLRILCRKAFPGCAL
jgi:ATP-binding cassette subfamily B protein